MGGGSTCYRIVLRPKGVNIINVYRIHDNSLSKFFECVNEDLFYLLSVDRNKYQIHIPLPPKIDPTVTMMQVRNYRGQGVA